MSEQQKVHGYTNLDLQTAEDLYVAAGHPEQAEAARYLTQGWRNMWQSEYGQTFLDAFERVMAKHIEPLAADMSGLRMDVQQWAAESATRLGKLESRMADSEADRADLRQELEQIKLILAERPKQRAAEHQALLKAIRDGGHVQPE